ncbi:MAG: hypothetical protein ACK4HB_07210 [Candidatus Bipolaricaulia bacterium]
MIAIRRCPPAEGLIATGTYYLHQGQRKLGEEAFQFFELPDRQGYHLQSFLVLQWPMPHTQRVTLELDPTWRYRTARIELEAERHLTLARYHVDDELLRVYIEAAGRRPVELSPSWNGAFWDYPTAIFATALCKRLRLAPGDSTEIEVVRIALPSLEPEHFHCTCARLFDHRQTFEIGDFAVREFVLGAAPEFMHIWVDEAGVPVCLERHEGSELVRFDLVRYRLFRY